MVTTDDQMDLFAPPPGVIRPDGLVHAIREVKAERGTRTISVRCGAAMPKFRTQDRLSGASAWNSEVTCSPCKKETHQ